MPGPKNAAQELFIRRLKSSDAEAVATLSSELGYPCDPAQMRSRLEQISSSEERHAFAAVLDSRVVGWIEASIERHLQSPDVVLLGGLVVQENLRGCGIGRRLCEAVEDWAKTLGVLTVRVRSQIKREDAHRFYLRDGYERVKTSAVFEKKLR